MCLLSVVLDSNYPVRQNYADVDLRSDFDHTSTRLFCLNTVGPVGVSSKVMRVTFQFFGRRGNCGSEMTGAHFS